MKRIVLTIGLAVVAGIALLPFSCSKKDSSDTSNNPPAADDGTEGTVDGNPDVGQIALSTSDLATTYPIGLAVTAVPQAIDPSPGQAGAGTLLINTASLNLQSSPSTQLDQPDPFKKHPKEILEEAFSRLEGKADSCFDPQVFSRLTNKNGGPSAICFGSEYGIIAGLSEGLMDPGTTNNIIGSVPAPKNSSTVLQALKSDPSFQESADKEVCMVVKAREYTAKVSERINAAMDLVSGMICAAKKADPTVIVPAVGASIDLTDKMTGIGSGPDSADVTSAVITRKKDQDGRPVLLSEISFKISQRNTSGEYKIRLIHSPSASGNGEYNGALQVISDQSEGSITRDTLLSLGYVKTGNTLETQRIRFEAREGNFVQGTDKSSSDPLTYFGTDGRLDLNAVDPDGTAQDANKYLSGMYYLIGDVNPSTYAGSLSVWNNPGGNYQEAARGFIFQTAADDKGILSGCAWAGAFLNTSIRKSIKTGIPMKPSGCYTPQITGAECKNASNPNDNQGPQVWKQCFVQDTSGKYELDLSKIEDDTAGFDLLQTAPSDMPDISAADFPAVVVE